LVDGIAKCNGLLSQLLVNGTLKDHPTPDTTCFTVVIYDRRGWRAVIYTVKVDSKAITQFLQCSETEIHTQNLILPVLQSDGSAICTELRQRLNA
jgi:hypothetical protein